MPFNFPNSPTVGQQVINTTSSIIYQWNGTAWITSPLTASQAITASYALNAANATKVTIGDNAPALADYTTGSLWFNSQNLGLYVNYQDADSGQWVGVNSIGPIASASLAATASFVRLAQTASLANTASYALNGAISYLIPNTFTTPQWVLLGTWTTFQDGCTLRMNINAHAGYNAQNSQNQVTELNLVTSNGTSTNPSAVGGNFYLTGLASRNAELGTQTTSPGQFRIVQVTTTSYQVYAYFGTFSANSHYTVSISPGTFWTNSGILPGTTPGGTYLDIFPSQLGGMAYANFTFNTFPTTVGDFTPIIGNASGITLSGTTITLANAGIYLLQANLTVRSTFAVYEWMTLSNTRVAGTTPGVSVSANSSDTATPAPAIGILNAAAGSQIKLRLTNQQGAVNTFQEYASAQIIQIR